MQFVIEHLEKRYEKKEVLRDASFAFASGKIYGLLGRNGAGKTTLFNCINETREELPLPTSDADWTSLYRNLVDVIDNGAELIVKPEQVRRVLQLIEAIFASAKSGHSLACAI